MKSIYSQKSVGAEKRKMTKVDKINATILRELLKDSRVKLKEIAEKCGVTPVAVKKRVKLLKKKGIIVEYVLIKNMTQFSYPIAALICINLLSNQKINEITDAIQENCKVYGIDKTFGEYDLCVYVFAKSVNDLDEVKTSLLNQKTIDNFEINIWNKVMVNYRNIEL